MATYQFTPQLTRDEALALASRYPEQDDAPALEAGRRIKMGECSRNHLEVIHKWKTKGRGKSRLTWNSDAEIEEALWMAVIAKQPRTAIAALTGLSGVEIPMASAIATVIRPDLYTIIDFRALEALGNLPTPGSIRFYLEYLEFCKELACNWGMWLRQLDRALWQWSAECSKNSDRII